MCQKVVIPARCAPPTPEFSLCNRTYKPYFNLDSRFIVRPAGCPGMTRKGFTLIELLVVVLIIGILSAVALPQYQVAVEKSRLGRVMSNVKTIKNAAEVHYLAAGEYGDDITVFDIGEISGCRSAGAAQLHCAKTWYDWNIYGGGNNRASAGYTRPYGEFKTGYVQFGDYSQTPGVAECWAKADDSVANQVCKSMGGVASRTQSCPPSGPSCQIYRLP